MGLLTVVRNIGPLISLPVERMFNEPIPVDPWSYISLSVILVGVSLYVGSLLQQHQTMLNVGLGLFLMVHPPPSASCCVQCAFCMWAGARVCKG